MLSLAPDHDLSIMSIIQNIMVTSFTKWGNISVSFVTISPPISSHVVYIGYHSRFFIQDSCLTFTYMAIIPLSHTTTIINLVQEDHLDVHNSWIKCVLYTIQTKWGKMEHDTHHLVGYNYLVYESVEFNLLEVLIALKRCKIREMFMS